MKLVSRHKKESKMTVLCSIILVVFIAYSILGWTLYFMQSSFLYSPVKELPYNPGDLNLPFEKIVLTTEDGLKLAGWYVPAENAEVTILFCHGNGGNMTHRLDTINLINELGLNCFIFDYRGYGNSQGKPTEEGTYLDAHAAWKWLTLEKHIASESIIIFGRSLGGCIAANLATKVKPRGLVVESTFTSYVDIGQKFYPYMPIKWFASFSYRTVDFVRDVNCPIMFFHSRNDEIIPFEFGQKLYDIANEPKQFTEIFGSHNDGFLFSGDIYRKSWIDWLDYLKNPEANSKGTDSNPAFRISSGF